MLRIGWITRAPKSGAAEGAGPAVNKPASTVLLSLPASSLPNLACALPQLFDEALDCGRTFEFEVHSHLSPERLASFTGESPHGLLDGVRNENDTPTQLDRSREQQDEFLAGWEQAVCICSQLWYVDIYRHTLTDISTVSSLCLLLHATCTLPGLSTAIPDATRTENPEERTYSEKHGHQWRQQIELETVLQLKRTDVHVIRRYQV